ncbi:hypothetical protein EWM64_g4240 [Hericium alpestre]|uniref:RTA1-domain-containing protein n=1 Tax=Hericium alpestre TaxID=135208 RepID=A0A4Z0A1Q8_9AGAM|nr:hypothetical protein EWM64_g4240 [Hericium alpestre]
MSASSPPSTQPDGDIDSPYNYVPTEWICALFVALYSVTTILHIAEASWKRMWWLFPTAVLAGLLEILGWVGRLWSSRNPPLRDPYLMQIICTIIAPTPLVAANFVILGRIIGQLGGRFSRLSAGWYTILFCSCDIIALVVQAVGGAMAATAVQIAGEDASKGGHIMLGGIVFQLAAIIAYAALATEFLARYWTNRPFRRRVDTLRDAPDKKMHMQPRMKLMIFGMVFMTILLFIRSVYRTIELSDGWNGRVISTQVYFNVLDGAAIVLAMFTLNVFHPGLLLDSSPVPSDLEEEPMNLEERSADLEAKPSKPFLTDSQLSEQSDQY